jgi:hypothetical protein
MMEENMTDDEVYAEALSLVAMTDEVEALIAEKTRELNEYTDKQRESRLIAESTLLMMSRERGGSYTLTLEQWFNPVSESSEEGWARKRIGEYKGVTIWSRSVKALSLDDVWMAYGGLLEAGANASDIIGYSHNTVILELPDGRTVDPSWCRTIAEVEHMIKSLPMALKDGAL